MKLDATYNKLRDLNDIEKLRAKVKELIKERIELFCIKHSQLEPFADNVSFRAILQKRPQVEVVSGHHDIVNFEPFVKEWGFDYAFISKEEKTALIFYKNKSGETRCIEVKSSWYDCEELNDETKYVTEESGSSVRETLAVIQNEMKNDEWIVVTIYKRNGCPDIEEMYYHSANLDEVKV